MSYQHRLSTLVACVVLCYCAACTTASRKSHGDVTAQTSLLVTASRAADIRQPSNRSEHALAIRGGKIVLFGGYDGTQVLGDTLEYDGKSWVSLNPPTSPQARAGHAMASLDGKVVLFGGLAEGGHLLGDTWQWDGTTWQVVQPSVSPPARTGHVMATLGNKVVLFGGKGVQGYLSDTWEWDGTTWVLLKPAQAPPPRERSALVALGSTLLLFGGANFSTPSSPLFNDLWQWDGRNWTNLSRGDAPPARFDHSLTTFGTKLLLFGGSTEYGPMAANTWEWNGSTWVQQFPAISPSRRASHKTLSYEGKVLLFGGTGGRLSRFFSDTWEWNGTTWSLRDRGNVSVIMFPRPGASASTSHKDLASCMRPGFTAESFVWVPAFAGNTDLSHQVSRVGDAVYFEIIDSITPNRLIIECAAPTETANLYRGRLQVVSRQGFDDHWHHFACTWTGARDPVLFIDGKRQQDASVFSIRFPTPLPRDLFIGYASGSPQGKVFEEGELRLSSTVRYTSDFTPLSLGARFEPDAQTCGLWHFDEGYGSSTFMDTSLKLNLQSVNGATTTSAW